MWKHLFRRTPRNTLFARPRLLVIALSYDSALPVAEMIEREGFEPVFAPAAEVGRAEHLQPLPVAALVLREVPSDAKQSVCAFLRASRVYAGHPIAAQMTLMEGAVSVDADAVIRPPGSINDALMAIRSCLAAREATAERK